MRTLLFIAFSAIALAQPKLAVSSATNKQISISWTGITGPAAVERRPAGGKYEPLTKVPQGQTYTDAAIDAMGTYQYRVHADAAGAAASNEVIAGPPPTGYTIPVPTPKAFIEHEVANFARSTAMELDSNGDPAILYTALDPSFKSATDADMWFLHWDRAAYKWKAPVKIANFEPYRNYVSLTRDAAPTGSTSKTWATVTEHQTGIDLYISSDDGATWTKKHQIAVPEITVLGRAVAMFGGQVYWLHSVGSDGIYLLSGTLSDEPSKWKKEKLPVPEPFELEGSSVDLSIAVDSQGRPGMTYFVGGPDSNVTALYWRPGMAQAQKIQDSNGVQNDYHNAVVTYAGAPKDQAKFLVWLSRNKDSEYSQMWIIRDTGGQMAISPALPTDGGQHSLDYPFDLSFDNNGQGAALLERNGGNGTDKCGSPKLARGGATGPWKTCSPDPKRDAQAASFQYGMSLRHAVNNKLYGAFSTASGPLGPGVILWREP